MNAIVRAIRSVFGASKREAAATAEREEHRQSQALAMMAVNLKVRALEKGAERMNRDCRRAEEAAAELMHRIREDFQ